MQRKKYLIPLLILALTIGCVTASRNTNDVIGQAYNTLSASAFTYETTMTTFGSLYTQGQISEEVKADILKFANIYATAHNAAVSALMTYKTAMTTENEAKLDTEIIAVTTALADLVALTKKYVGETK